MSGSEAAVIANPPTADYMVETAGTGVAFAFNLEADDVVQAIKR